MFRSDTGSDTDTGFRNFSDFSLKLTGKSIENDRQKWPKKFSLATLAIPCTTPHRPDTKPNALIHRSVIRNSSLSTPMLRNVIHCYVIQRNVHNYNYNYYKYIFRTKRRLKRFLARSAREIVFSNAMQPKVMHRNVMQCYVIRHPVALRNVT